MHIEWRSVLTGERLNADTKPRTSPWIHPVHIEQSNLIPAQAHFVARLRSVGFSVLYRIQLKMLGQLGAALSLPGQAFWGG